MDEDETKDGDEESSKPKRDGDAPPKKDASDKTGETPDDDEFDRERAQKLIDKLRGEVAEQKKDLKKLADLEKQVQEIEDADKSESEKLAGQLQRTTDENTKLTARVAELEASLEETTLTHEITLAAARTETAFRDPEDALAFVDRSKIERDDDGKPTKASIERELKEVLKRKPHLAPEADDKAAPAAKLRVPPTPKASDKQAASETEDEKRTAAARATKTAF